MRKLFFCIMLSAFLVGCEKSEHKRVDIGARVYTVRPQTVHKSLYFTGIVQPLRQSPLTTPMNATVEYMHYFYGDTVAKGRVVFTLSSEELAQQYNDIVTEYLKAKDNYSLSTAKFTGTEDLWQAGLLSKNNYLSEKSSLNTIRISLMQSSRRLTELLEKIGDEAKQDLSQLSFAEFNKVQDILSLKHDRIYIKSPVDGVLLYPPKSVSENAQPISVGSAVKSGQVLAMIGDLQGIRIDIDIPEIDIDKLKRGMDAVVRGVALGKQGLLGNLVAINAEASMKNGSVLPSFTGIVEVKSLNAAARALIKVGMSAEIEVAVDSFDKLLIPISAVVQDNGKNTVLVRMPGGHLESRSVITGMIYADQVVIDSGLKNGDLVLY